MDVGLSTVLATATPFALPLATAFRGVTMREGVLIAGPSGWGEFAPFDDYDDEASARWLATAIEAAYGTWPSPLRMDISANAILPGQTLQECAQQARRAVVDLGCTVMKMQVGKATLDEDVARVAAVRQVLDDHGHGFDGAIRLDAKARWTPRGAAAALRELAAFGIEYVEQPCERAEELRELRTVIDIPIAADESIRLARDPGSVVVREFADIAILKPAPLGGVERTLALAESVGIPVVVSGSLDSSVGLAAVVCAAACLPGLERACGLGTGALFAADLVPQPLLPVGGFVRDGRQAPDAALVERAEQRVSEERAAWWRERLTAAWAACPPEVRAQVEE